MQIAELINCAAHAVNVDFIGGFSAQVEKGMTQIDANLFAAIPEALAVTQRVCASVNVGSTRAGLNMDAIAAMGGIVKQTAALTASVNSIGCAKLVVFCNAVEDNPFMAGVHGVGEPECAVNVGVSGPGAVLPAVKAAGDADSAPDRHHSPHRLQDYPRGRVGRSQRRGPLRGSLRIVDLSLAPTRRRATASRRY